MGAHGYPKVNAGLFPAAPPCQKRAMQALPAALLSIAMLAAFVLAGGGLWLLVKRGERKRGLLMLAAAAVMLGNVLIWTV
jgi:hypothetical protein